MPIIDLFGSCPPSQIAQVRNGSLSMIPSGAGVPLGVSGLKDEAFAYN